MDAPFEEFVMASLKQINAKLDKLLPLAIQLHKLCGDIIAAGSSSEEEEMDVTSTVGAVPASLARAGFARAQPIGRLVPTLVAGGHASSPGGKGLPKVARISGEPSVDPNLVAAVVAALKASATESSKPSDKLEITTTATPKPSLPI